MSRSTVLVLAKEPVPGRVKTRLCPPLSPAEAARVAEAAIADTLAAALAVGADRVLLALDGSPGPWLPSGVEVVAQRGATFNERLDVAWSAVDGPCVQLGMDTPQVTPRLLEGALASLEHHRSALGPALDGGWWALALHRHLPGAFDGIAMSEPTTGTEQLARLGALLGEQPHLLPALTDVDRVEDLVAVAGLLPPERSTAAIVRRLAAAGTFAAVPAR